MLPMSMYLVVNLIVLEHIGELDTEVLSHPCMNKELDNPSYRTAAIRHRKQQVGNDRHRGFHKPGNQPVNTSCSNWKTVFKRKHLQSQDFKIVEKHQVFSNYQIFLYNATCISNQNY